MPTTTSGASGLPDRHLEFVSALRTAGLPVSLAEGLDAVDALTSIPWSDRWVVRDAYAATLVKKQSQRPAFDALFDLFFPAMVGDGMDGDTTPDRSPETPIGDNLDVLEAMRRRIQRALRESSLELDDRLLHRIAADSVSRYGVTSASRTGASQWSAYETLQALDVQRLVSRLVDELLRAGMDRSLAEAFAQRRLTHFITAVHDDIERRTAELREPGQVASERVRPTIERLDFTSARHAELAAMRREIYPLARRLATRLAREQRARGGGPLDFRRTVRASMGTGGIPMTTRHRPKRPHRTNLVVLCDISGSVAHFAQFTLLFVYALREVFQSTRAFTFIDGVHEVTDRFRPGADPSEVIADLAGSTREALLAGRTDYGRVFERFAAAHRDALGPRTTLLILGDARSNYSTLGEGALHELVAATKRAIWLNPEPRQTWGIGDSAAYVYGRIVDMTECRNLEQLSAFVHDLA